MLPALLVLADLGIPQAPAGFERCEQLAASRPEAEATAACFDQAGTALHQPERAQAGLAELLRRHPKNPWPDFFLYRRKRSVDEMARIAADFAARKDAKGEVIARVNLYR